MQTLHSTELENVSGGFIQFFTGYVSGKVLDAGIAGFRSHVGTFSQSNHSASNEYFLKNQHLFNTLI